MHLELLCGKNTWDVPLSGSTSDFYWKISMHFKNKSRNLSINTHHGKPVRSWNPSSTEISTRTGSTESSPEKQPKLRSSDWVAAGSTAETPSWSISESSKELVEINREWEKARDWASAWELRGGEWRLWSLRLVFVRMWNWRAWERVGRKLKAEGRMRRRWEESLEEVAISGWFGTMRMSRVLCLCLNWWIYRLTM